MPDRRSPFLLGLALSSDASAPDPRAWSAHVCAAEDAGLDLVTLHAGDADAALVGAFVAARTRRIGIVPALATTTTEPFHVSTAIATVDGVGAGRGGWLAEVLPGAEAQGRVTWTVPDDVVGDGAEHVAAVRALWDSWEDGAEIRDAATARFLDRGRVHHVDLEGRFLSVRGPSITPRPPQGHPPVFVRATDAGGLGAALARAAAADVVISADPATPPSDAAPVRLLELDAGPGLGDAVSAAGLAGYEGVLVRAADPALAIGALAPLLGERPSPIHAAAVSLRGRLGLPPAANRFASAR